MLQTLFSKFAFYSYWGMALVATIVVAVIVAMVSKSVHRKFFGVLAGVLVMLGFIAPIALRINADKQVVEAKQDRYAIAKAIFDERCKMAGEKIYKTVDNVEGVTLLKVRGDYSDAKGHDPMWEDAALIHEAGGKGYIQNLMGWNTHDTITGKATDSLNIGANDISLIKLKPNQIMYRGYRIIDVLQQDGSYLRYTPANNHEIETLNINKTNKPNRFLIDFINFTDKNDRKYWIAGTKVTITDSQTNELLAEKTWYTLERGQGSNANDRVPWLQGGVSCPTEGRFNAPTRYFVEKVLKPKQ